MRKLMNNKWIAGTLVLLGGLVLGLLLGPRRESPAGLADAHHDHDHDHVHDTDESGEWTCSMHPQIRQDEPGDCPICGMDLIPAESASGSGHGPMVYEMTPEAVALANVHTSVVSLASAEKEVRLTGKIGFNEQKLSSVTATFPGRVEQLHVNFTGQEVNRGDVLATVYSAELLTAQQELLQAVRMKESFPALYRSAREKLRLWRLTDGQIDEIESSGRVRPEFEVLAGIRGVVTGRNISQGDYVSTGTVMFEIADLSSVWVMLDAYESDLAWINPGSRINFTVPALPGQRFEAEIAFIDPVISPQQRTATVRAEAPNPGGRLKPDMFVNGTVRSNISPGIDALVIPRSALLWSGKRSLVYVKLPGTEYPAFEMREIVLGPRLGDMYVVENGLDAGEEIVTNGVFAVDASAQLSGNFSMMARPPVKSMEVPSAFREQLTGLAGEYFKVKYALVESDPSKASAAAGSFLTALSGVDMSLLDDEPHHRWMSLLVDLSGMAGEIGKTDDLELQRQHFEHLSMSMIDVVEYFGLNQRVYKMYCPMAFDDEGAYWLSDRDQILNPYFGDAMLACGVIEQTYRQGARVFGTTGAPEAPVAGHNH
jgi:membrane fusion protein, copper/silver efflux system